MLDVLREVQYTHCVSIRGPGSGHRYPDNGKTENGKNQKNLKASKGIGAAALEMLHRSNRQRQLLAIGGQRTENEARRVSV
ncbi:MAG: hypothetical protein L6R28_14550 [Planctomycetes bacterium]|nr:hypothetical protein [Planctomycetota bacterium]